MYLEPWQIFVFGCFVGIMLSVIVIIIVLINLARKSEVVTIREEDNKDAKED